MTTKNFENLYLASPIWLQNIGCSIRGWQIKKKRFGKFFYKSLEKTKSRISYSSERFIDFRNQQLKDFLQHCYRTVPYYKKIFNQSGFNPERFKDLSDLKYLPILKKTDVQGRIDEFISNAVSNREKIPVHTSGTTGTGLKFYTTKEAIQKQWSIWWRYWQWHGIEPGTWCAYFGGRIIVPLKQKKPPFWRYNYPGQQILFSGNHISPKTIKFYIDEFRRRRPPWLHGYPSALTLLADYLINNKIGLGYTIRWVTVGAESLLEHQANTIKRAFGVYPKQHYGMAEAVANFSECEGEILHVDEDFAAVEFIGNSDGSYKIIGTNFTNRAFPLIRYQVGDNATLLDGHCKCGKPGRLVANIDGRAEDYIIKKDESRIGRMDHIFKDMVNIKEAQIFQEIPGEIKVRIVRGKKYNHSDERLLRDIFIKRLGSDMIINFNYVDRLEREGSGKLRFVISKIKEGQIA